MRFMVRSGERGPLRSGLWLAASIVALDQLTKAIAEFWLELYTPVPLLPGLNLTLVYNEGAAFSLLSDAGGWQRWLFVLITVVIVAVLLRWLWRLPPGQRWTAGALAAILGGAIGNLIDRIATGRVVDFIDLYAGTWHWPAFNVADSAITVGAVILVGLTVFVNTEEPPPSSASS